MSTAKEVKVPDIGDFSGVEIIDVLVKPGDEVHQEESIITLESDKAAMDVPMPFTGKVSEVKVKTGDQVSEGDVILLAEVEDSGEASEASDEEESESEAETETAEKSTPSEEPATPPQPASVESPNVGSTGDSTVSSTGASNQKDTREGLAKAEAQADQTCEVLVLGSGPGGYTAAFRAADLGRRVTLIERYPTLGGVCLNVGCIPSKALLHASQVIEEVQTMSSNGIRFGDPEIDIDKLRAFKQHAVDKLTGGLVQLAKKRSVELVTGRASFESPHLLKVETEEGTRLVAFEQAIIAAGSEASKLPGQPDDPRIMDSTAALELADIPKRLLVVGGGIIGLEMADVYAALGSEVTIIELTSDLMLGADRDLVRILERRLRKTVSAIYTSTRVSGIKPQKNRVRVTFEDGNDSKTSLFDRVLVAVGRRPNGHQINAAAAGVRVDERGFIPVDRQLRTNVEHIFAIGDINGAPMLAHKASHEGKIAAEASCGRKSYFDARVIPSVAYTHPEVAWAGLTETEATKNGVAIRKGTFPWAASGRALTIGESGGLTKLIFDENTNRIVGAGIVGPNAGELISELALAIEMGCDVDDIALTVHPHPTLSETVGMAAEVASGTVTDLYLPK